MIAMMRETPEFALETRFLNRINVKNIFQRIHRGSFPALAQRSRPSLETFYNSYVQTYLDRDLRDIFNISKLTPFRDFLRLCAARTGQILNYSSLAKDIGVSVPTVQEWIRILEASMHVYLLRPYFRNLSKQMIKAPKLYFLDTGLAAFLTKWESPETLMNGAMAGAFFETFVVSEIIKSYLFRGEALPLFYFRDKRGHEVDVVIERDGILYPIEIKMGAHVRSSDFHNISYLRSKSTRTGKGAIISLSKQHIPIDRQNDIIPVTMIS